MGQDEKVIRETRTGRVSVLTLALPPVNSFGPALRKATLEALQRLAADPDVDAVVITGDGRMFCGGADIREFDTGVIAEPGPNLVHGYIENFPKPVVAAIHGYALGGGLELALSCHARIAAQGTRLSLPEISLGIIPGSGGTQRLARLIGIEPAIDAMLTARSFTPAQALAAGLLDDISTGDLIEDAVRWASRCATEPALLRRTCAIGLQPPAAKMGPGSFQALRAEVAQKYRGYPAALKVVDCVEKAVISQVFDDGLRYEADAFRTLMLSDESKAMRHLFFCEREAARPPAAVRGPGARFARAAVIGSGTQSAGIALALQRAGLEVVHIDGDGIGASALEGIDIAIEAAEASIEAKQRLARDMGTSCPPNTLLATATCAGRFDALAQASGRPQQFVGLQFTTTVDSLSLLEIGREACTSDESVSAALAFGKRLGLACAISRAGEGLVGPRLLEAYLREVDRLLLEGCTPSRIDTALELFGMAVGPCRWMDLAGVDDQAKAVGRLLRDGRHADDASYRQVCQSLHAMGRHGRKAAAGYFRYQDSTALPDPIVGEVAMQLATQFGITRRLHISDDEIVERCIFSMVNEGYALLSQGIARQAGDIDAICATGYGFPRYRGGPMHHAERLGAQHVLGRLQAYGDRMPRWRADWQAQSVLQALA